MPFLWAKVLIFQGSAHQNGVGSLSDLVKLYGAYIEYTHKIDEDSFVAFYNNTKERVLYIHF